MRTSEPSVLVLVLSACAAPDRPLATPSLPTTSVPAMASPAPSVSATPSGNTPTPVASVSAGASSSFTVHNTLPQPAIPTTPLAGTLDGRPFAAVSSLAVKDPEQPDWRMVWIFDRAVACGAKLPPPGVRAVSVRAAWQLGDFGTGTSTGADGTYYSDGGTMLELPTQPGARARLRLVIHSNTIELAGEVHPTVCP